MSLLWAGFLLGCGFGVSARLGRLCLLRGLRQRLRGDAAAPALRAFALALATAMATTQYLAAIHEIDLSQTVLLRTEFAAGGLLIGGLLFGLGMSLARSCGARALVLLAGGNLRALVVLAGLGLAAQASLTGVLVPLRQWLQLGQVSLDAASLPAYLASQGLATGPALLLGAGLPVMALLFFALRGGLLRRAPGEAAMAVAVGLLVTLGWWITTHVGVDEFDPVPPTSLSFIGPVAESLLYVQLAVGRAFSLGPAIVSGTLAGAGVTALVSRNFVLEGFEAPRPLLSYLAGGLLMGFGGVLAVGCSIGQGLSGLSTLALASLPACGGIIIGACIGLAIKNTFIKK
ncbi:YeeE/YedE thiosulfate transporter family protein [Malikia sp.]|uniref:YeeE/YedE thiosulfate transporter family protein n=1 Tax=Malikia sp. TaxID=2070706 RepID=UPI002619E35B|nr:YeeE/YedE thiosulfate transporter family protein [Malikia sp.]MDD2729423.1 YeeE/YedE thiosulfate transporter family protein [Malikia sp.]